ncbi:MAG TPA: hypothetical protein VKU85_15995, partial [bacterium]|nr:hypothetical protein [bacterium]
MRSRRTGASAAVGAVAAAGLVAAALVFAAVGAVAAGEGDAGRPERVTPKLFASIHRHEIHAAVDVPAQHLHVVDTFRFHEPVKGRPFRFLLNRELALRSVALPDGTRLAWTELPRWDPRHFWARPPYEDLDDFGIVREIEVTPPAEGWGIRPALRVEYAGVVADSLHEPQRAYGRSFETTSGRIVSEGAYLAGSTFWVPWCGESMYPFDLTVDLPAEWRVVSQGEERSDEVTGGRRKTRWICADPMEEIYLVAGPYELHEVRHGDLRVLAYAYENTGPEVLEPYLSSTGPVIDRYAEQFGPYPYKKFALVENYWQTGYGMPSFTFLGDRVIRLPFIVDTSYPHEI